MERPLVIELAGLAGAGKSAIAAGLAHLDPGLRVRPHVSGADYLASAAPLLPTFVSLHWPFRGLLSKEMKRILRLGALHRVAQRSEQYRALVFDEGPVYMLARILVYGGENIRTRGFARWWRRAVAQWAATLDVVVWLDAPDAVLAERIHTRPQWHHVQGAGTEALTAFLRVYRTAFTRVITELTTCRGPELWTVGTERGPIDLKTRELLARLDALRARVSRVREIA